MENGTVKMEEDALIWDLFVITEYTAKMDQMNGSHFVNNGSVLMAISNVTTPHVSVRTRSATCYSIVMMKLTR